MKYIGKFCIELGVFILTVLFVSQIFAIQYLALIVLISQLSDRLTQYLLKGYDD